MSDREAIREFISKEFLGGKKAGDSEPLLEKGVIDSVGVMRLVTFLEKRFGIVVKDKELVPEVFKDLGALSDFVAKKRRK